MTFGRRSIPPQQGQQPAQKGNRRRRAPRYQTSTGTTVAAPQRQTGLLRRSHWTKSHIQRLAFRTVSICPAMVLGKTSGNVG